MNNAPTTNGMTTGNVLKSYLVSIGINFDQEKLKDIQNRIKNFANMLKQAFQKPVEAIKNFASKFVENFKKPLETVKNFAGKISKAFADINKKIKAFMQTLQKAFTAIGGFATAVISASIAVGKFMNTLAKQDLELDNFSRRMGISKKTAREFKSAVDSLGASVEEIQFNPELLKQYKDLVADGRKMAVAGDYDKAMANVRSLGFEFVRLKNEANYVFQWVGYYLTKYLSGPMKEAKKYFQGFNEWIIKNTPQISAKIAEVMARIVDVFGSVFKFFGKVSTALSQWWGSQPTWVKNMMAGAGILGAIFLGAQNPLIAIGMIIAGIFLLIDDYQKWTEGKKTAFGKIWAAITEACKKCKETYEDWKKKAIYWMAEVVAKWYEQENPIRLFWKNFQKWIDDACDWGIQKIYELLDSLKDFMGKLGFFYAQVQTRKFGEVANDIISGQFDRDYEEAKQGNPNLNTSVSEDLIEQRMLAKNMSRKEAIRELRQEGKIGPRRIQESFNAGVQASQALNNPPKPKGYNPQTDKYDDIINEAAQKYGVSQNLIKAVIAKESSFNPKVVSNQNAQGLMQLTPIAQKDVGGVKNPFDPRENILKGTEYLKKQLDRFGDKDLALIAYNAGPTYAELIKEEREKNKNWTYDNIGNEEARDYVKKINSYLKSGQYAFKKENARYNQAQQISTGITDRLVPIKQIDGNACGIVSVAMANNAINGNNNLTEANIYSAYKYDLLRALNGTNKNKNIRWHDIQHDQGRYGQTKITDSDLKAMYEASKQGLPFIFGANGPKFSPSGYGHFMVGKKVDWEKQIVYYADPATGTIEHCTFKELKNAKQRLDGQGNPVFIPKYLGNQKAKQQTPTINKKNKEKITSSKINKIQSTTNQSLNNQIKENTQMINKIQDETPSNAFWNTFWNGVIQTVDRDRDRTDGFYLNLTVNVTSSDEDPYKTGKIIGKEASIALQEKMQFIGLSRNLAYG